MRKKLFSLLLVMALIIGAMSSADAESSFLNTFNSTYGTAGTVLNTCSLCHTSVPALNPYGNAYAANGFNFAAIESLDSDGDGFSNITEINARTFPGNPASTPPPPPPPPLTGGAALYGANCAGCHRPLESSNVKGKSAKKIQEAINKNKGGMGYLSFLTSAEIQSIADALASKPTPPPTSAMPLPKGEYVFTYDPVALPVLSSDPGTANPIGVGPVADQGDTVDIKVNIGPLEGPVDVSFGMYAPGFDFTDVYHIDRDGNFKPYSKAKEASEDSKDKKKKLVIWKKKVMSVNEGILGPTRISDLAPGLYVLTLNVRPSHQSSDDDSYYRWVTYFVVP